MRKNNSNSINSSNKKRNEFEKSQSHKNDTNNAEKPSLLLSDLG